MPQLPLLSVRFLNRHDDDDEKENDEERKEDLVAVVGSLAGSSVSCSLIKKKYLEHFVSVRRMRPFEWAEKQDRYVLPASGVERIRGFAVYVSGTWKPYFQHAWRCCCVVFFFLFPPFNRDTLTSSR